MGKLWSIGNKLSSIVDTVKERYVPDPVDIVLVLDGVPGSDKFRSVPIRPEDYRSMLQGSIVAIKHTIVVYRFGEIYSFKTS